MPWRGSGRTADDVVLPRHNDSNGWWALLPPPAPPRRLRGEHRVRIAVIGAGVCGVAAARRLAELRPREQILLVEAERAGYGASGRNAGFMLDLHAHGQPGGIGVLRRHMRLWAAGLSDMRELVRKHRIRCDWNEWGRLYASAAPEDERNLDDIAGALDQLGLAYEWRDHDRLAQELGTEYYLRGLHAPGSALVNPAALMRGLAAALPANVDLFEQTAVLSWTREKGVFVLATSEGRIRADRLILAAGVFLRHLGAAGNRYVPVATYASLSEPLSDTQKAAFRIGGEFGLLASSASGATIRLTQDGRLFVRSQFGSVPAPGPSERDVARAAVMHRRAVTARWPFLGGLRFEHSWGGVMAFTANGGTVFGEIEPGLFVVLAHDVSPMTRGNATGRLIAELAEKQDSELLSVQMSLPEARRLPPRPLLDLAVAWKLRKMRDPADRRVAAAP